MSISSPHVFPSFARRALILIRARYGNIPRWRNISKSTPEQRSSGTDVLIASNVGSYLPGGIVESLFAARILARGLSVSVVICDGVLPACMACTKEWLPNIAKFSLKGPDSLMCAACQRSGPRAFKNLPINIIRLSQHILDSDRELASNLLSGMSLQQLAEFTWNGVNVGEHGRAGAIRFLKSDLALAGPYAEDLLRRFCIAAILTTIAYQRILEQQNPKGVLAHHGVYVPQGVVTDLARRYKSRYVSWMPSYRKNTLLFSFTDTYHKSMVQPLETELPNLTDEQSQQIQKYLIQRETGVADWISFSPKKSLSAGIARRLQLDATRPIVTLYTNVAWDAQVHFEDNIFSDMFEWLRSTITFITSRHPSVQVVVRVHPGEVSGQLKSEQPVVGELTKWTEIDWRQVRVVDAKSDVSSYALANMSQFVIIYASKIGIELAAKGIKVLVGGEAWVKNKGISVDPSSREEYFVALEQLIVGDSPSVDKVAAEKFAYHVFFRVMQDVSSLTASRGYPPFRVTQKVLDGNLGTDSTIDSVIDYLIG